MKRHTIVRRTSLLATMLVSLELSGCAYAHTERLTKYDLSRGYRFDSLPLSSSSPSRNSEQLFVVLAFSGGGTRAAAMSYGVLAQLRQVKFHYDEATGAPVGCAPADAPRCRAMERSLLDEVDVISSVSGGSFTSAYYALYGDSIFNRQSTFQANFLYHRVQSDLVKQMVYYPKNWQRLQSRIEIAADYYAQNIFGDVTFAALERRPRPYLILNATDASTGGRFEFSQEQFDLLCADLSRTPVARGVASSSAFPALLNSLTIDSFNAQGGCDYHVPQWETDALRDTVRNPARYRRAQQQARFRDPARKHLHLLDGGLADNLGLRGIIKSMTSSDQPDDRLADGRRVQGGWSLNRRINLKPIKRVIVITVDSRTNHPKNWDSKAAGPGLVKVVDAAAGIPMGNFTTESIDLMRETARRKAEDLSESLDQLQATIRVSGQATGGAPSFHAIALSLDDVAPAAERAMLNASGTNFELPEFLVNCLVSRSAGLLRESRVVNARDSVATFTQFVDTILKGTVGRADVPTPADCGEDAGKRAIKATSHTIDVALKYNISRAHRNDIDERQGLGLDLRVAKPNGLGAVVGVTMPAFGVPATLNGTTFTLGRVRLYGVMAGAVLSRHLGPVEISSGVSGGYAFGNFRTSGEARAVFATHDRADMRTRATSTWLAKPNVSLWYSTTGKLATTVSASYLMARPVLRFEGTNPLANRTLQVNALQLSAGIGYRIF